jgi:deoxyribonuclease V
MRFRILHGWDVNPSRAVEIQELLRERISLKDSLSLSKLRSIAGADVSYDTGDATLYGAVVVVKLPGMEVVEQRWAKGRVTFPYVPGLLSFREAPILLKAFALLRAAPDAVMLDGQGIAHPRGFGLGSHLGLLLDLPSIGCAKSRLIGDYGEVKDKRGSFVWLSYRGRRVGMVVRTRASVKPVFISPGHRVSFRTAMKIVLLTCRGYRLPEPIRLAHQLVNRMRLEAQ